MVSSIPKWEERDEKAGTVPSLISFDARTFLFESSLRDIVSKLQTILMHEEADSNFFACLLKFCEGSAENEFYRGKAVGALFSKKSNSAVQVCIDADADQFRLLLSFLRLPVGKKLSLTPLDQEVVVALGASLGIHLLSEPLVGSCENRRSPAIVHRVPSVTEPQASGDFSPCFLDSPEHIEDEMAAFHQSRNSLLTDEPDEIISGAPCEVLEAFLSGTKSFAVDEDF